MSFGEFFACPILLGVCEGTFTPRFLLVISAFYTHKGPLQRVVYRCMCL